MFIANWVIFELHVRLFHIGSSKTLFEETIHRLSRLLKYEIVAFEVVRGFQYRNMFFLL